MDRDATVQEISNLFDIADRDRSDSLSREEVAAIMTQIKKGIRPSDDELQLCVVLMDKNNDGIISREEFIEALGHWLEVDVKALAPTVRSKSVRSLGFADRQSTLNEMANFFRQFTPVKDYALQQKMILSREPDEHSSAAVTHEFPEMTKEMKAELHARLQDLIALGRLPIMAELHSLDWNVVLDGVNKVKELLSVAEVFHQPYEK
jgi:hypothetical protein